MSDASSPSDDASLLLQAAVAAGGDSSEVRRLVSELSYFDLCRTLLKAVVDDNCALARAVLSHADFEPGILAAAMSAVGQSDDRVLVLEVLLADKRVVEDGSIDVGLWSAVKHNSLRIVRRLLEPDLIMPHRREDVLTDAFRMAARKHHVDMMRQLIRDPGVHYMTALLFAANNGNEDAMRVVLDERRADPSAALRAAARSGNVSVVCMLLDCPRMNIARGDAGIALQVAAQHNHLGVVRLMLQHHVSRPVLLAGTVLSWELIHAAEAGHADVLRYLLSYPEADPTFGNSRALRVAATEANAAAVEVLLVDGRANPSVTRNNALFRAIDADEPGSAEVVRLLLADVRVRPHEQDNRALMTAIENNRGDIVRLLLNHVCVDADHNNNAPLLVAARRGYTDIVAMLLALPETRGVDPTVPGNRSNPLVWAAYEGHVETVRVLLEDARVDPAAHQDYALATAADHGHVEVVRALLARERVNPRSRGSGALICALNNRHVDVVYELMLDGRSDFTECNFDKLHAAVRVILDNPLMRPPPQPCNVGAHRYQVMLDERLQPLRHELDLISSLALPALAEINAEDRGLAVLMLQSVMMAETQVLLRIATRRFEHFFTW